MKTITKISMSGKKIVLFIIFLALAKYMFSQHSLTDNEKIGMNYSYETNTVLKNRMFIQGNYTVGRKSFEFGISMDSYKMNTQGFMLRHKVFLNSNKPGQSEFDLDSYSIRPYVIYKFIMFSSTISSLRDNPAPFLMSEFNHEAFTSPTINTIEHYIGIGTEFKLFSKFYFELMATGGVNFIKNNSKAVVIDGRILPKASIKPSWNLSFGINYKL